MQKEELDRRLEKHAQWLENKMHGDSVDLRGANLSGVDITGANLAVADLDGANLSGAVLNGVNFACADLRRANLTGADLTGARLVDADLTGANLTGVDLTGANLADTNLTQANLTGANLTGTHLWWTRLSGADLTRTVLPALDVPAIPQIDIRILDAIEQGGELNMRGWHHCETAHCRAGWAIHLAGEAGYALQRKVGPSAAGALIYAASGSHPVPDWHTDNETALADLKRRAAHITLDTPVSVRIGSDVWAGKVLRVTPQTVVVSYGYAPEKDKSSALRFRYIRGAWRRGNYTLILGVSETELDPHF